MIVMNVYGVSIDYKKYHEHFVPYKWYDGKFQKDQWDNEVTRS